MVILLLRGERIKLKGLFFDESFGMFANDVNHATASVISESDRESEGEDDFDHFFTLRALEEAHLLFFSGFFAGFTGIVSLFFGDFHDPAAKLGKNYSTEE